MALLIILKYYHYYVHITLLDLLGINEKNTNKIFDLLQPKV